MIDIPAVKSAASAFRGAIESIGGSNLSPRLHNFPKGACGDSAYLLGAYLSEIGLGCFDYVCGIREQQSHAWLEKDNVIVDITADQFEGGHRVYVGLKNAFYRGFTVNFRHTWNASLDGKAIETDQLFSSYKAIRERILNLSHFS